MILLDDLSKKILKEEWMDKTSTYVSESDKFIDFVAQAQARKILTEMEKADIESTSDKHFALNIRNIAIQLE